MFHLKPFMTQTDEYVSPRTRHDGPERSSDPAVAPRASRADLLEGFRYCLKVFLAVRGGLFLIGLIGVALIPANAHGGLPGWELIERPGWTNLFTAWERWDALWFLQIADNGYAQGNLTAAFFPLYPLAIRGVAPLLGGHPLAAALVISNVAYLGALFVFYELTRGEYGTPFARRSALYMALFPTAYFFGAPYTESLFLLLAAGALLAARRGRWEIAGGCGALASATRSIGLTLVLALAVEAALQWRASTNPDRNKRFVYSLFWSGFAAAGTAAYLYYWQSNAGDFLVPVRDQNGWLREFSWPWETLVNGTNAAFDFIGQYSGGYHQLDWLFVTFGLATLAWVALKVRPSYAAYALAGFITPLFFAFAGRPFMSMPRFMIVLFPMYWALARFSERFRAHEAVVAVSAAGLGLMTLLFVGWYWVF